MTNTNLPKQLPQNPYTHAWMDAIRAEALPLVGAEIPPFSEETFAIYRKTGSRKEYEREYFEKWRRLNIFVLLSLWEADNPVWIEETERVIRAILDEGTWAVPAHVCSAPDDYAKRRTHLDLFACETSGALADTLVLLEGRLNTDLAREVYEALRDRTALPYLAHPTYWGANNWSAVCAGSLILMFTSQFPELLEQALPSLLRSMQSFVDGYPEDGCCLEGPIYWEYGFGYFVYGAERLRTHTGGKIDLFRGEKIRRMAEFGFRMLLGESDVIPFADAPHTLRLHGGLMHFLCREFGISGFPSALSCRFGDDLRHRFAPMLRDLIWYDPALDRPLTPLGDIDYPSAWYLRRRPGYVAVLKAGHNAEPHNHNDVGSFLLYDGGFVLDDPGWQEYTRDFFGNNRYRSLVTSSAGHSVPEFDGHLQVPGHGACAKVLTASADQVEMDLSAAYDLPNLRFTRTFTLAESTFTVLDRFSGAQSVTERITVSTSPTLLKNGFRVGNWLVTCSVPCEPHVLSNTISPRFAGLTNTDESTTTVYRIEFPLPPNTSEVEFVAVRE